jgi:hypothetical protein
MTGFCAAGFCNGRQGRLLMHGPSRRPDLGIAPQLPILHHLFTNRRRPERKTCRVLVLSPTRELSSQILDSFRTYGR